MQCISAELLAVLVVMLIVYFWCTESRREMRKRDSVMRFSILSGYKDGAKAFDLMDRVNNRAIRMLAWIRRKYFTDGVSEAEEARLEAGASAGTLDPPNARRLALMRMLRGYNPEALHEHSPREDGTSYTVNKGESMQVCVRQKEDEYAPVDEDVLLFVFLHELAHIANRSWGHDAQFWSTFKFVLLVATESGEYTPTDYSQRPVRYCGLDISSNPLYTPGILSI